MDAPPFMTSGSGSVDNSTFICDIAIVTSLHTAIAFYSLWAAAVAILILYCFLQKRKKVCSGCCTRYPGLFVPLNLIQTSPYRILYVIIFGSLTGEILVAILSNNSQFAMSGISSGAGATLTSITLMTLLSVLYAPLFASVEAPIPALGFAIGFFYGSALLTRDAVSLVSQCTSYNQMSISIETWLLVGAFIPVIICKIIIICWFLVSFIHSIIFLCRSKKPLHQALFEHRKATYHHDRVRWLVTRWKINIGRKGEEERSRSEKMEDFFYKWIYGWDSHIQFPLRYLAAVLVMFFAAYNLTLVSAGYLFTVLPKVLDIISRVEESARITFDLIPENSSLAMNISGIVITLLDVLHESVYGLNVILPAGPLIAFVFNTVLLFNMVIRVHIHLKRLAKGDLSFLPQKIASPAYRLVQSIQYLGYQIAYFVWAWIVAVLVVWAAGIACFIIYEFGRFYTSRSIEVIATLILPFVYSFVVYYIQLIFCKLVFVGDTNNKHMVINNLRFFHWFTYFLLFQNLVTGITSAFLRILYSLLFGVLLLFRLDRVVLMRGFERFDKGHKTYIAILLLEHTLNNSVLNVFVELLTTAVPLSKSADSTDNKQRPLSEIIHDLQIETTMSHYPRISKQALNRWMVAYTLIRNPGLQKLTGSQIRTHKELEKEQNRQWRALHRQRKDHLQTDKKAEDSNDFESAIAETTLTVDTYDMFGSDITTFQQATTVQMEELREGDGDSCKIKDIQEDAGMCLQELDTNKPQEDPVETADGLSTQEDITTV